MRRNNYLIGRGSGMDLCFGPGQDTIMLTYYVDGWVLWVHVPSLRVCERA